MREDCRCIPTVADWLRHLPIEPWMVNGVILPDTEFDLDQVSTDQWRAQVASRQTMLGFADWQAMQCRQSEEARKLGSPALHSDERRAR